MSQQGPHFNPHSKAKGIYKSQMSGNLVTSGISDVATHSVHSEKNRLMKMLMIIIMNLSKETTVLVGARICLSLLN